MWTESESAAAPSVDASQAEAQAGILSDYVGSGVESGTVSLIDKSSRIVSPRGGTAETDGDGSSTRSMS